MQPPKAACGNVDPVYLITEKEKEKEKEGGKKKIVALFYYRHKIFNSIPMLITEWNAGLLSL